MVNVRRTNDGANLDFYGDYTGNLISSAGQKLANWLTSTTGYVTIWYDQSGSGKNATQTTAGSQPQIMADPNGSGKYVVYF